VSAKNLSGAQTEESNICQIRRIDRPPAESDEDGAPESISATENWLNWNGDLGNPIGGKITGCQTMNLI